MSKPTRDLNSIIRDQTIVECIKYVAQYPEILNCYEINESIALAAFLSKMDIAQYLARDEDSPYIQLGARQTIPEPCAITMLEVIEHKSILLGTMICRASVDYACLMTVLAYQGKHFEFIASTCGPYLDSILNYGIDNGDYACSIIALKCGADPSLVIRNAHRYGVSGFLYDLARKYINPDNTD